MRAGLERGSAGLVGGDAAAAGLVGGCAAAELCIVEGGGAGLYAGLCVATHLRLRNPRAVPGAFK